MRRRKPEVVSIFGRAAVYLDTIDVRSMSSAVIRTATDHFSSVVRLAFDPERAMRPTAIEEARRHIEEDVALAIGVGRDHLPDPPESRPPIPPDGILDPRAVAIEAALAVLRYRVRFPSQINESHIAPDLLDAVERRIRRMIVGTPPAEPDDPDAAQRDADTIARRFGGDLRPPGRGDGPA